jgi:hypothetical protein
MSLLYNKAECYISAGIYEGFDLPILEASACHLPCIIAEKSPQRNLIPQQNQFECFEKKIFGTKEKLFEPKFESLVQKITDAYNRKLKVADVLGREYDINIIARQIVDYFFKKIILKQRNEKYFE